VGPIFHRLGVPEEAKSDAVHHLHLPLLFMIHYYVDTCHQKAARDQNRHHAPSSMSDYSSISSPNGMSKKRGAFPGKTEK